jgi:hypothetical protein
VYLAGEDAVFVGSARAIENWSRRCSPPMSTGSCRGEETTPYAGLTVGTTGGAPAAIVLVAARLAALVLPNPQTLHDAAPMLALAALNIPTFDERGNPVSYPALKARLHELARPSAGHAAYHPVPRLVFSRRPELGRLLAQRIWVQPDALTGPVRGADARRAAEAVR